MRKCGFSDTSSGYWFLSFFRIINSYGIRLRARDKCSGFFVFPFFSIPPSCRGPPEPRSCSTFAVAVSLLLLSLALSSPDHSPGERRFATPLSAEPVAPALVLADASSVDHSTTPTIDREESSRSRKSSLEPRGSQQELQDSEKRTPRPEESEKHPASLEDLEVPLAATPTLRTDRDLRTLRRRSGHGQVSKLKRSKAFFSSLVRSDASALASRRSPSPAPESPGGNAATVVGGPGAPQDTPPPHHSAPHRGRRGHRLSRASAAEAGASQGPVLGRNLHAALHRGRAIRAVEAENGGGRAGSTKNAHKKVDRSVQRLVAQAVRTPAGLTVASVLAAVLVAYVTWRLLRGRVAAWVPGRKGGDEAGQGNLTIAPNDWVVKEEGRGSGPAPGLSEKRSEKEATGVEEQKRRANDLKSLSMRLHAIRARQGKKSTRELQKESRELKQEIDELYPALLRLRASNAELEREIAASALGVPGTTASAGARLPPSTYFFGDRSPFTLNLPLAPTLQDLAGGVASVAGNVGDVGTLGQTGARTSPLLFGQSQHTLSEQGAGKATQSRDSIPPPPPLPRGYMASSTDAEIAAMDAERRLQQAQAEKRVLSKKLETVEGDVGLLLERLRLNEGRMTDEAAVTKTLRKRNEALLKDAQQKQSHLLKAQQRLETVKNYAVDMERYSDVLEKKVAFLEEQLKGQPENRG
ncbi:hypothetical protein TGPRC2_301240 [Toxoplasma gondii TgCatPRC2]|uniref:Uncharacterized protein n=1 Tax=Toxoplasma gondii TgCatPRC2 TaxID=1130821 RepID=A0A151H1K8_TOXGO|nr:hypothetical protein TGPRC2_301240 [Toxoplasma gondii TgCatPRC2]